MPLPWLSDNDCIFPPVSMALQEPDGLLAAGGDLSVERLTAAYQQGIFPWYEEDQPILWWSPNPRMVLLPDQIHISKSLKKLLKNNPFTVTFNQHFSAVIEACSMPRNYTDQTWITEEMQDAYTELHAHQLAHSVEVWKGEKLVGGLYGVAIGQVFFGESMFSTVSNASKVALSSLCLAAKSRGYQLIDCQVSNPHLKSMGAEEIARERFIEYLKDYTTREPLSPHWQL